MQRILILMSFVLNSICQIKFVCNVVAKFHSVS